MMNNSGFIFGSDTPLPYEYATPPGYLKSAANATLSILLTRVALNKAAAALAGCSPFLTRPRRTWTCGWSQPCNRSDTCVLHC